MPTDPGTGGFDPTTVTSTLNTGTSIAQFPDATYNFYNLPAGNFLAGFTPTQTAAATMTRGRPQGGGETSGGAPVTTTAQALLNQYLQMVKTDPNSWASIQSAMKQAGAYGTGTPDYGRFNTADGDALGESLKAYMALAQSDAALGQVPITYNEWLAGQAKIGSQVNASAAASGGSGSSAQITITDAATLDSKANAAAQTDLGRNLSAAEQAKFVKSFQGQEIAAGESGASIVSDPSRYDAQNAADQDIQSQDNTEYQGHLQADYAEKMLTMLGVQQ